MSDESLRVCRPHHSFLITHYSSLFRPALAFRKNLWHSFPAPRATIFRLHAGRLVERATLRQIVELNRVYEVLYVKPNGAGILVNAANNYVPIQGDTLVPRGLIERLHLDPGLFVKGQARRTGNGFEFVTLEAIEKMTVEEFREARRPFSE